MRFALASFGLLLFAAFAASQTPEIQKKLQEKLKETKKAPDTLDEKFAQALKTNPDIRVAEAKLREAEAEVTRVRLVVLQKLRLAEARIAAAKAQVSHVEARWIREKQLYAKGTSSLADLSAAEAEKLKAQAELVAAEAELPYLLGQQPGGTVTSAAFSPDGRFLHTVDGSGSVRIWDIVSGKAVEAPARGQMPAAANSPPLSVSAAEKLRGALDLSMKADLVDVDPEEALRLVQDRVGGMNIHFSSRKAAEKRVSIKLLQPIPIGAFFQFLEDETGCAFIIRDYGIVVVDRDRLPPGAALLMTFWRQKPAKDTATKPANK